jgi:hypothetical protein
LTVFDYTSRYYPLETALWSGPDGRTVPYKRRRLLPQPESLQPLARWPVVQGDRFDLIAARTLGDSQAYWRIADANRVMDPNELAETPGRHLLIPMPQPPTDSGV